MPPLVPFPQPEAQVSARTSPDRQHWYGSEEFLALPAQLQKTEMLAMKLESLAQSIPLVRPVTVTACEVQQTEDPPALMFLFLLSSRGPVAVTLPRRLCRMWMTGI